MLSSDVTRRLGFSLAGWAGWVCSGLAGSGLAGSGLAALGCGGDATAESAQRARAQLTRSADVSSGALWAPLPSSGEKQEQILQMLERFVPHAESFFRASDLVEPRTDYFAAVGSGVTQPRGAGNLAFAYVTLLEGRPEQRSFAGVPRATLLEHTVSSLRHEALTNTLSGAGYARWGNGSWQASLEAFSWGFAAWRLWPELDA